AADGTLDRKAVATLVFDDADARRVLNAITHPRVGALFAEKTAALDAAGELLACYEVPLLYEVGLDKVLAPVVVVAVPAEVQVQRAAARDGATEAEIRARIAAQMPLDEKARRADYVIDNSGELPATLKRADELLEAICVRLGVEPTRYAVT